jgi:hypothetical protein
MRILLALVAMFGASPALAQEAEEPDADADADPDPAEDPDTPPAPKPEAAAAPVTVPAPAAQVDKPVAARETESDRERSWTLSGYLQPQVGMTYRPSALPRDKLEYGASATAAGIEISGQPWTRWGYDLHLIVAGESREVVTGVETVDSNGDGVPDDVSAETETTPSLLVERATINYQPVALVGVVIGQMRIPFTAQEQSPQTALMFPQRSGPNEVFLKGPDLGALAVLTVKGDLLRASLGAFNGSGAPVGEGEDRGLVYSLRVDVNALGPFPFGEGDLERGRLRVGVGAGLLYYPASVYDASGYLASRIRDLRSSASLRLAARGLYLQAEVLRRQRTDSLSSRPVVATGAYGQGSYFLPIEAPIGLAPIARIGYAAEDQGFDPRKTLFLEAGITVYPRPDEPDDLKVVAQYLGERRLTEGEDAHGAILQVQLAW